MEREKLGLLGTATAGGLALAGIVGCGSGDIEIGDVSFPTETPKNTLQILPTESPFTGNPLVGFEGEVEITPLPNIYQEKVQAHDFALPDVNGDIHRLSDYDGRPRVIIKMDTCGGVCQLHFDRIHKYTLDSNLFVILVAPFKSNAEKMVSGKWLVDQDDENVVVLYDDKNELRGKYGRNGFIATPGNVFIGKNGELQQVLNGLISDEQADEYLSAIISGEDIIVPDYIPLASTENFNIPKIDWQLVPSFEDFDQLEFVFNLTEIGLSTEQMENVSELMVEILDINASGKIEDLREPIQKRLNMIGEIIIPAYCDSKNENLYSYLLIFSMLAASNGSYVSREEVTQNTWQESEQIFNVECL